MEPPLPMTACLRPTSGSSTPSGGGRTAAAHAPGSVLHFWLVYPTASWTTAPDSTQPPKFPECMPAGLVFGQSSSFECGSTACPPDAAFDASQERSPATSCHLFTLHLYTHNKHLFTGLNSWAGLTPIHLPRAQPRAWTTLSHQ